MGTRASPGHEWPGGKNETTCDEVYECFVVRLSENVKFYEVWAVERLITPQWPSFTRTVQHAQLKLAHLVWSPIE